MFKENNYYILVNTYTIIDINALNMDLMFFFREVNRHVFCCAVCILSVNKNWCYGLNIYN